MVENVTVLIGIAFRESAIAGIIHQPFFKCPTTNKMGRTIWGLKDVGSYGYNKKSPPENKLILTTTRSHSNEIVNSTIEAVKPDEVLKVGGCGFKVLQVRNFNLLFYRRRKYLYNFLLQLLEGKAHCYVFASPGA